MDDGPSTRPLTLGTAGHIDHGKTTLVKRLTGENTDRLAEERRRGISIELGFAELRLPDGAALSVVDVPGHERFVRTMVAGATGVDFFLMVVAADDGPMPQTREHWAVLRALGVERGVVALTKCDIADPGNVRAARDAARKLIPGIPLVETSCRTGQGLEELRERLAEVASATHRSAQHEAWPRPEPLLHVDRVFTLRGIGRIVTGTLWSGVIGRGDRIEILPDGNTALVRSVQVHDHDVERALAGQRVALNLSGIGRASVRRGDVVAAKRSGLRPTYRLDVELELEDGVGSLDGQRVQVHHGTRDTPARVVGLDDTAGLAQLRAESSLIARAGDRFVIRSIAQPDTLGGGLVVDARPRRHGPGPATARLRLISSGAPENVLAAALAERETGLPASPEGWGPSALLAASRHRFSKARWQQAADALVATNGAARKGDRLVPPDATTKKRPTQHGSLDSAGDQPESAEMIRALLLLQADGAKPRGPQALADSLDIERHEGVGLLEELVRVGKAVRLNPSVYYPRPELDRITQHVLCLIREQGPITVAELRDALGTSRKYATALLEYLDSTQRTVRLGDRHVLRRHGRPGAPTEATLAAGRQGSGGPSGLQSQ